MRCVSWNLGGKMDGIIQCRVEDIVDCILNSIPDILCLQECTPFFVEYIKESKRISRAFKFLVIDPQFDKTWGIDSFCLIMSSLEFTSLQVVRSIKVPMPLGPMSAGSSINNHEPPSWFSRFQGSNDDCGLLWTVIQTDCGNPIVVGTTLLEPLISKDAVENNCRLQQLEGCLSYLWSIAESDNMDAILLGDLNIYPSQEHEFSLLLEKHKWRDIWNELRTSCEGNTVDWERNVTVSKLSKIKIKSRPDRVLVKSSRLQVSNVSLFATESALKYAHYVDAHHSCGSVPICPSSHFGIDVEFDTSIDGVLRDEIPCRSPPPCTMDHSNMTPSNRIDSALPDHSVQTPDPTQLLASFPATSPPALIGRKRRTLEEGEQRKSLGRHCQSVTNNAENADLLPPTMGSGSGNVNHSGNGGACRYNNIWKLNDKCGDGEIRKTKWREDNDDEDEDEDDCSDDIHGEASSSPTSANARELVPTMSPPPLPRSITTNAPPTVIHTSSAAHAAASAAIATSNLSFQPPNPHVQSLSFDTINNQRF